MENQSEQINEVVKALIAAQKSIETLTKNKIAKGNKFDFAYADLAAVIEAIKEPLNTNGVLLTQAINQTNDGNKGVAVVETQLIHESGQWLGSRTPVFCEKPNDPQAFGSGVSYSKRYALMALLGIPTEDDDGKAASKKTIAEIKEPTEQEKKVLDAVCAKLKTPEGMEVDSNKVAAVLYALKSGYPKDIKKAGTIVAYLESHNSKEIFKPIEKDEPEKEQKMKPLRYICLGCGCEFSNEGLCPECASPNIIDQWKKGGNDGKF